MKSPLRALTAIVVIIQRLTELDWYFLGCGDWRRHFVSPEVAFVFRRKKI